MLVRTTGMLIAMAAGVGCARISSTPTYTETLIDRESSTRTVADSRRYTVRSKLGDQAVDVVIRSEETCRTKVTPIYRKEAHITRTAAIEQPFSPAAMSVYGLVLGSAGIYSYATADTRGVVGGTNDELTPDEYRTSGIILGATGAVLLGIALVDAIRLVDEDKVIGEVAGEPEVTEEACHAKPVTNAVVVAKVGRLDFAARGTTDANGSVRLDLHELPEDAFARPDLGLTLDVDGETVQLAIAAEPTRTLRAALEADATSRVVRDREAKARASCAERVREVAEVTIDADSSLWAVERAEADWRSARSACGSAWEPAHEQAQQAFAARVAATAAERATRTCMDAGEGAAQLLAQRLEADEELLTDELASEVDARCAGASNAAAVRAGLAKKIKAADEERALVAQREQRIAALDTAFRRNDALGVRTILAADRRIASALRMADAAPAWLTGLATHWIRKLERGEQDAGALRQLCAARALVLSYLGEKAWTRLRTEAVGRVDVAQGARLAKVLEGGVCP
jgi:hypothetical protein